MEKDTLFYLLKVIIAIAVFDRITNQYQGSFTLQNGTKIDGTNDTDGIDVTNFTFGNKYPKGIFIAQDGANTKNKDSLNQNFKIVNWTKISEALNLKVKKRLPFGSLFLHLKSISFFFLPFLFQLTEFLLECLYH